MSRGIIIALVSLTLICIAAQGQQSVAGLAGRIVNAAGQPIAGGQLTYDRIPDTALNAAGKWVVVPGQPSVASAVTTSSTGAVTVPALPPGRYQVCAEAPGYLNSCAWFGTKWVTLKAGDAQQLGDIELAEAARVRIRIQDPLHLLPAVAVPSAVLNVGVRAAGDAYYTAVQAAADADGRDAEIQVPFGQPLQFWAYSWKFQISGDKGAALDPKGARIPFQADKSKPLPTFTITIVGEAGSD